MTKPLFSQVAIPDIILLLLFYYFCHPYWHSISSGFAFYHFCFGNLQCCFIDNSSPEDEGVAWALDSTKGYLVSIMTSWVKSVLKLKLVSTG